MENCQEIVHVTWAVGHLPEGYKMCYTFLVLLNYLKNLNIFIWLFALLQTKFHESSQIFNAFTQMAKNIFLLTLGTGSF
jgi:hypothetical protein